MGNICHNNEQLRPKVYCNHFRKDDAFSKTKNIQSEMSSDYSTF